MSRPVLKSQEIEKTLQRLQLRIADRFPASGLSRVCADLYALSKETDEVAQWIARPNLVLRFGVLTFLGVLAVLLVVSISQLNVQVTALTLSDLVQISESALNELVLLGAGILFLVTLKRASSATASCKQSTACAPSPTSSTCISFTKDPDVHAAVTQATPHSPQRELTEYELGRYLDYCAEMLSLVSKIAFIYVNNFDDPVANSAVNELENLTNGLSRKIWQKIMILKSSDIARLSGSNHSCI